MSTLTLYVPHRWTDVHMLRNALRARGVETRIVRDAAGDGSNTETRINWGGRHPYGVALNETIPGNKLKELITLNRAGVAVPPFTNNIDDNLTIGLEPGQWLPRTLQHRAAADLLNMRAGEMPTRPFYVQRLSLSQEFRIHVFRPSASEDRYVSIRAGLKVASRPDAHPWIRTLDTGWNVDYGTACQAALRSRSAIREQAKLAVKALGLDFGAVDVGVTHDGRATVLEVNTAPGLRNAQTANAYARHIAARMAGVLNAEG